MLRLLRWGTFLVLLLILIGVILSYPILRDRYFSPILTTPAPATEILANLDATAQPTRALKPSMRTTLPPLATRTIAPALVIAGPSPSATNDSNAANPTDSQPIKTPTPIAIATTSLLPASGSETPEIVSLAASLAEVVVDGESTVGFPVSPPLPSIAQPPASEAIAGGGATGQPTEEPTGEILTEPTIDVTPIVVLPVEITAATSGDGTAIAVTPIVVTTVELTPQPDAQIQSTPLPLGPIANTISPLYSGPDFNSTVVGQINIGEQLIIIGWYTEGTWYLLANGLWLPGAVVDNAPLTLPLVFPTITPVPTTTPTVTFTPPPTATPPGSPTVTPTPTSLDEQVCDCSGDTLDCLGNIFANRAEAQRCFEYCFRKVARDIHLLDPNLNGVACENLP